MNPKMMLEEQTKLQRKLDDMKSLTTAPFRYIKSVEKTGTALGKTYKQKLKAA